MFVSVIIIAFAVVGILLTLLTAAAIGFYLSPVPGGSNAVGLVIPFLAAIAAGLAGLIAGAVLGSRGGADWMGVSRPAAVALMIGGAVLVGLSIFRSFLAWSEKHRFGHPGLLMCTGVILPLCYFGFVIAVDQSLTRLREVVSGVSTATDRSQLLQPLDEAIAHHVIPPKSR